MSPVASRWEVPRKSVGSGWVRVTSQPAVDCSSGPRVPRGRRRRWRGRRAGRRRRGRRSRGRRAVRRPRSPRPWRGGGSGGRPGGPARPAPPTGPTRFHSIGRRWRRSRASAISCAPADGRHAQRQRERLRGERGHQWCAVPAQGLVGQQGRPTERLDPGVAGGGVEVGPVGGQLELAELAFAEFSFVVAGELEHSAGVEVADLVLLPDRGAHGSSQASTTDTRGRESPVSTGVSGIVTYL